MTPEQMVAGIKQDTGDWQYDVLAIGYPGQVKEGRIVTEPRNLAPGWVRFDFAAAFGPAPSNSSMTRLCKPWEATQAAIDEAVPAHVLTAALYERFSSRGESAFADKLLSAMRYEFGGHIEKSEE